MGTITVWGASRCREPHSGNAGGAWGYRETPKAAGKRQRKASERVPGGPDKIAAASQAALGEAQQSFARAKTT